jgi:DNA polymerase-3 subunit alpha
MKMLIDFGLIPDDYAFEVKVYNFNKYLKKNKDGVNYLLDEVSYPFYERHFDVDKLIASSHSESGFVIKQTDWDSVYKKYMDKIRPWVKSNAADLLEKINQRLVDDLWEKYATGDISKWEMESISCYIHDHELIETDYYENDLVNYFELDDEPEIERVINTKDGKRIPLLKIHRVAGTVLDRDKLKKTVTLLTREGVVTVKIFGDVFTHYDRQISVKQADGKKKVLEKSWFSRGNKIIVTGIRRDEQFFAKKYKNTPYHLVNLITEANIDGTIMIQDERLNVEGV